MMSKVPVGILLWVLMFLVMFPGCELQRNTRVRQRNRGSARNNDNGMNPVLHRAYVNAVTGDATGPSTTTVPSSWESLVPTLPAPENVECHVEVTTVHLQGGRCIRTGGIHSRPYFCQSGRHLTLDSNCEAIINRRRG